MSISVGRCRKSLFVLMLCSLGSGLLSHAEPHVSHEEPPLTPTEITVLGHILEGKTGRYIATVLCRSPRTIEVHRSHIMRKLGVSTLVDSAEAASAMGLLSYSS